MPPQWAQTRNNLAEAYYHLEDWRNSAGTYANVLMVYPDDKKAYFISGLIYQDMLSGFSEAFELNRNWLKTHPEDVSAHIYFAERHFTTGRFGECEKLINSLLENPDVGPVLKTSLIATDIANLHALDSAGDVPVRSKVQPKGV